MNPIVFILIIASILCAIEFILLFRSLFRSATIRQPKGSEPTVTSHRVQHEHTIHNLNSAKEESDQQPSTSLLTQNNDSSSAIQGRYHSISESSSSYKLLINNGDLFPISEQMNQVKLLFNNNRRKAL